MPRHMLTWSQNHQNLALSFTICGLYAMVLQWQADKYQLTPHELAQLAATLLTQPLLRR